MEHDTFHHLLQRRGNIHVLLQNRIAFLSHRCQIVERLDAMPVQYVVPFGKQGHE